MKSYRPNTPSRRHMSTVTYRGVLTHGSPVKPLTGNSYRAVGRNNVGRITMRHKGGGHKRLFRAVDFVQNKINIPGKVVSVEYDPNRLSFISFINYKDGDRRYILTPKSVKVGKDIITAEKASLEPGNRLLLKNIPVGTFIYNIELKPMGGGKLCRSAGNYAELVAHDAGYAHIKLPSSEVRRVPDNAWASVGSVSNEEHYLENIGKAGRSRWLGVRPTVRGSAMNPVDRPYGGGEGRQGRGTRYPKTIWGKHVDKGQKSRRPKKYSNRLIVSRRKVGKKRNAV